MGFRISWIAAQASEEDVLNALQARKTGATDEFPDFDLCSVTANPGWTVIWSNDEEFFDDRRCLELSRQFVVIGVHVNETVMYSDARWFEGGSRKWAIWHEGHKERAHLETDGDVPPLAAEIERQKRAEQIEDDANNHDPNDQIDLMFEIPLALAESYTGFKHDEYVGTNDSVSELASSLVRAKPKSFLSRIFGR